MYNVADCGLYNLLKYCFMGHFIRTAQCADVDETKKKAKDK